VTSIETKRLLLREWRDEDIVPFAAMNQDPAVMRFFPHLFTFKESRAAVLAYRECFEKKGYGLFAVELKTTGEFIGFVGLHHPTFEAHFTPCVEISWRLASMHWHQGYATQAARAVLHAAFERYGFKEVVSFTAENNLPSRRVMEKLGMTHDVSDDFDHPRLAKDHPLCRHVLYRMRAEQVRAKDAICIMPYDARWQAEAAQEIAKLKQRCCFSWLVDIVHIGSTAIPGLASKPILDIAIGVTDLVKAHALIAILIEADYVFWEDNPDPTKLFFVKGMPPFGECRTHHIHVMDITHHDWVMRPLFRDYLIAHPELKKVYAQLKQKLAEQYQLDREKYTEAKTAFIRGVNLNIVADYLASRLFTASDVVLLLRWFGF